LLTYDDHEVQNNWAGFHRGVTMEDWSLSFVDRRANSFRAYYEHLPLSGVSEPEGADMHIYRNLEWGDLLTLWILDIRQYRDDQVCSEGKLTAACAELDDPRRTMLGPDQERWLLRGLSEASAQWNVVGQQMMMAAFDFDPGVGRAQLTDGWDGYPAARSRILAHVGDANVENFVVLSGDLHSHWVNDLRTDFTDPTSPVVGTEIVGSSMSSPFLDGWRFQESLVFNPHVRFFRDQRGYVVVDVTAERMLLDMRVVDADRPSAPTVSAAHFEIASGVPGARHVG
jgi:phosphodiesterase/alkaline phosphatase D-like protein